MDDFIDMNSLAPEVRSIWTSKDEYALRELQGRRARIMAANRQRIVSLFADWALTEPEFEYIISVAGPLRDALAPFDERTYSEE